MTECKQFMPIDERINGQSMVLDWRRQSIIPRKEVHCDGDCRSRNRCSAHFDDPRLDAAPRNMEPFIVEPLDPASVLEASKKIIEAYRLKEPVKLSVGDLSVVSEEKRKRDAEWSKKKVNRTDAVTIGDLSKTTEDQRGLQELYVGAVPQPATSESQAIHAEMMAKAKKKREEVFKLRQIMFEQQQEKEFRREAARRGS